MSGIAPRGWQAARHVEVEHQYIRFVGTDG